jgi:hypothetical protein
MTAKDPTSEHGDDALVAGVVGAAVATATDMAVHATPLGRAAGVFAAVTGGAAAYALEHGGVLETVDNALHHVGDYIQQTDFDSLRDLSSQPSDYGLTTSSPPFVDDSTINGHFHTVTGDVYQMANGIDDILNSICHSGTIIDPVEPGTPLFEGKDFIE